MLQIQVMVFVYSEHVCIIHSTITVEYRIKL